MLILILIGVQYLQNAVFSFEKGSSFSKSLLRLSPPGKKILLSKISTSPSTLSTPQHTHTHELFFRMVVLLLGSHILVKYLYSFDEQSQTKEKAGVGRGGGGVHSMIIYWNKIYWAIKNYTIQDTISWIALFPLIDIFPGKICHKLFYISGGLYQ